jgi:putative ABC transport system permease protein
MRLDEIKYAFESLKHRKLRSFLSMLSILIGITAIFSLISFGLGIQAYVNNLAQENGGDKLFIQAKGIGAPGTDDTFFLSQDDVDFVLRINGVDEAVGIYNKPVEVKFKEKTKYAFMMGYDLNKAKFVDESFTVKIESGRKVKPGEKDKVALGYNYQIPQKIFERAIRIGDTLAVNGKEFTVVGFYGSLGNPQDDSNIYTSKEAFEELFPSAKDKYAFVMARAAQDVVPKELADRVQEKLRKHKGQDKGKEDFFVQTFEDAIATFQTVLNVINGILILIALVSVIVAAVNIMNTMYTAVMERTGEIGVMKAVGAKNSDILFVFVFEAGTLGATGGVLGVIMGFLVASAGGGIAVASGYSLLQPVFPWQLAAGCIFFAFLVGAGAGILPAWRASKLKPVEALRYE